MISKQMTRICLVVGLAVTPITRAAADGGDLLGGIVGGVIGGVIVNEANKNRQTARTKTVYRSTGVSSAERAERRETQIALNYFGFPAGTPDGVLGRNSQQAIASYQIHMGYPSTGQLTQYEKDFLLTSYRRALAGGPVTNQQIAADPMGPKGLLTTYRNELAGVAIPQVQPAAPTVVVVAPEPENVAPLVSEAAAESALPNFMGGGAQVSLASHCNTVSLLTNSNGGFTTLASMQDAGFALDEQFCLARTYAIAKGEELVGKVQGFTPQQIAQQCEGFGPAMKDHVAALSLKSRDEVLKDVGGFVLQSGMSPAQLSGTAKICLSVGYRTDNLDVAIGSALLLAVLGEGAYGELMGHHLSQGFGASRRPDLALAWYQMGLDAAAGGSEAVFAPGQPERSDLIRKAAFSLTGSAPLDAGAAPANEAKPLPVFAVEQ